jgi:hypothetical protein
MFTLKPIACVGVLLAISATLVSPAWAGGDSSDGHTHAAAEPVVPTAINAGAPRVTSQTDQFELVGVLDGKVLTLYLDHFATNAPVTKAEIEVASGSWKATATEIAPATYTVAAGTLTQTGKHPLTVTVLAGDASDLMDATLEVGAATPVPATGQLSQNTSKWAVWSGAAVLLLAALGLLVARSRKQRHKHSQR